MDYVPRNWKLDPKTLGSHIRSAVSKSLTLLIFHFKNFLKNSPSQMQSDIMRRGGGGFSIHYIKNWTD